MAIYYVRNPCVLSETVAVYKDSFCEDTGTGGGGVGTATNIHRRQHDGIYMRMEDTDTGAFWIRRLLDGREAYTVANAGFTTASDLWDNRETLTYENRNTGRR